MIILGGALGGRKTVKSSKFFGMMVTRAGIGPGQDVENTQVIDSTNGQKG